MTKDERALMEEMIRQHATESVERSTVAAADVPELERLRGRPIEDATLREDQLHALRSAVDSLCFIGNLEPSTHLTAVSTLLMRAMTPIRNLEQKLVRAIELERAGAHARSSDPTPGLAIK